MNKKEIATNRETRKHIKNVGQYINLVIRRLKRMAKEHDASKLVPPELELFTEYTPKLAGCTYGSDEYKTFLEGLKPALDHHYAKNRHHPEHYPNGIDDMNLVDLVELFCDWESSCRRHHDGNILKSIEINAKRFNIDPQLVKILENTAEFFEHQEIE